MWRRSLARFAAVVAVIAPLTLAACNPDKIATSESERSGDALGEFAVTANVVGTPVDKLVVTVTGPGITTAPVFNIIVHDGTATGTIKIPPGLGRTITVEAFDSNGDVTHEGHTTIDVRPGQNPPVSIPMIAKAGHVGITVQLGAVSIVVNPAELTTYVDGTTQLTATIKAPNGKVLSDAPDWATNNPTIATVDAEGKVTGVAVGTVNIVATYAGIAAVSHVTVDPACVGCSWTTARVQLDASPFRGDFAGLWGSSPANVYGVTYSGDILRYNGSRWAVVHSQTNNLYAISGSSPSNVWAVGQVAFHFDGTTWSPMANPPALAFGVFTTATGAPGGTPVTYATIIDGRIVRWSGTDWVVEYSTSETLYSIWGSSANDIFVGGLSGSILHYDGAVWSPMSTGTTNQISSLWGSGPTDVYAAAGGGVLHYDGTSWSPVTSAPSSYLYLLSGSSRNDVYAASYRNLFHFDGATWTDVTPTSWLPQAGALWGGTTSGVFFAGYPGGSVLYRNGSFTRLSLNPNILGAAVVNKSLAYAIANEGLVYRFDGAAWSAIDGPGPNSSASDIWAADASHVFTIYCSFFRRFDGTHWTSEYMSISNCLTRLWGASGSDMFGVGYRGTIAHYDGTSWSETSSGVTTDLYAVWGSAHNDVYAAGEKGTVLHFDGTTWSTVATPFSPDIILFGIAGTSSHDVFFLIYDQTTNTYRIVHFDGTNWTDLPKASPYGYTVGVFASRSADVYATGYDGFTGAYSVFRWDGSAWQVKATSNSPLNGIAGLRGVDVFAFGANATIMRGNSPAGAALLASTKAMLRADPPKPGPPPLPGAQRIPDVFRMRFGLPR